MIYANKSTLMPVGSRQQVIDFLRLAKETEMNGMLNGISHEMRPVVVARAEEVTTITGGREMERETRWLEDSSAGARYFERLLLSRTRTGQLLFDKGCCGVCACLSPALESGVVRDAA